MEKLTSALAMLQESLEKLLPVLQEENQQLSQLRINPLSLQLISDNKSSQLASVAHYDQLRKEYEQALGLAAPYEQWPAPAACWEKIVRSVTEANAINQLNGELLERHMKHSSNLRSMLEKISSNQTLYGAGGQTQTAMPAKTCNINV